MRRFEYLLRGAYPDYIITADQQIKKQVCLLRTIVGGGRNAVLTQYVETNKNQHQSHRSPMKNAVKL